MLYADADQEGGAQHVRPHHPDERGAVNNGAERALLNRRRSSAAQIHLGASAASRCDGDIDGRAGILRAGRRPDIARRPARAGFGRRQGKLLADQALRRAPATFRRR